MLQRGGALMSITLKLKVQKELFSSPTNNFRVLSCAPVGKCNIKLNKYKSLSLSGDNLSMLDVGVEYNLTIAEDDISKYPVSYKMISWNGENGTVKLANAMELSVLRHICDGSQPENIHSAYPHFVQMVIDGKESEIDYNKIRGVGEVLLNKYVEKIRGYFDTIKFMPFATSWGITSDAELSKLVKIFKDVPEMEKAFTEDPYHIFFDLMDYSFARADKCVLKRHTEMIDSKDRCLYACLEVLKKNEQEGNTKIYSGDLAKAVFAIAPESVGHIVEVVKDNHRIYYNTESQYVSNKATYDAEVNIANNIKLRLKHKERLGMDCKIFAKADNIKYTEEQVEVLELADTWRICLLRGNAGTGKSSVVNALVNMLEANNKTYSLLAPTGKAAKRIRETTGKYAKTIHMFLASETGYSPDFIILDEFSMVGVHLLSLLFNAVSKDTRFVFVCDESQLASISCGNVVQNIIDSDTMPTASLTKVFRYGTSGLVTIATDTRNGKMGPRIKNDFDDYKFVQIKEDPVKQVMEIYEHLLDKYTKDDIMILSPFNKGEVGTVTINNAIQARFNPNKSTEAIRKTTYGNIMFKVDDKVINTHNEYGMPSFEKQGQHFVESERKIMVMNGDIGYVRRARLVNGKIELAVEFDTGIANISGPYLNNLLLGTCISCHKSQGSQAKAVIVLTSNTHKRMLSRNLLYVADTRAQEMLIEIGDLNTIEEALIVQENKQRNTWLKDLLISS